MNKISNNPKVLFETMLYKISDLSDEQLKQLIEQAKAIGISQSQIDEGLKSIKSIKEKYSK